MSKFAIYIYEKSPEEILKFRSIGECNVCGRPFNDAKLYFVRDEETYYYDMGTYACSEECIELFILQNI